ncbi:MAG TPA: XdhC family protein [Anaerolineae bacterium]|nr:XdhC family protein [Anaerolineae bacterium]
MEIWQEIVKLMSSGQPAALATIISTQGSTPQKAGAKVLVLSDGRIIGTIGGGCVEAEVWQEAMQIMKTRVPKVLHFELTDDLFGDSGLICGGVMEVFVEPI